MKTAFELNRELLAHVTKQRDALRDSLRWAMKWVGNKSFANQVDQMKQEQARAVLAECEKNV